MAAPFGGFQQQVDILSSLISSGIIGKKIYTKYTFLQNANMACKWILSYHFLYDTRNSQLKHMLNTGGDTFMFGYVCQTYCGYRSDPFHAFTIIIAYLMRAVW